MTFLKRFKAHVRNLKYKWRRATEKAEDEVWMKSYARLITPDRLEVYDTHLLIDEETYVRCLVCGLPDRKGGEGYPRDLTSKSIERVQEISFDHCKIMLSHLVIQIDGGKARESLQQASYTVAREQKNRELTHEGSQDLDLMCKGEDVRSSYRQLYFKSQKSFYSSFIITMMGTKDEVIKTESYIKSILKSEDIKFQVPTGRMLEMFLSALPFPVSDSKSWVRVPSATAAALCTSTNLNSRTDERGLYFGQDLVTGSDILIDLDLLAAEHLVFLGSTGSGKTYMLSGVLSRAHDLLGYRIVYITPKADKGTDYKNVGNFYGENSCVIDLGEQGSNINPLQILFDKQSMGESPMAYSRAYDRHKDFMGRFLEVYFKGELSANMLSYLDETLNIVYNQAGIYRKQPETWVNANWPVMRNLRDIWAKDMDNPGLGTKRATAEAMFNKSFHFSEEGYLNYMNNPTTDLDLSKDYIVIDTSNLHEIIRDAMNVMVSAMIASRFSADNKRKTIVAVDEAAVFLQNPKISGGLLKTLTQGRSNRVYLWIATHQPSDFAKSGVKAEFRTNVFINVILGHNLELAINDVKDYFDLTDEEADMLVTCNEGEGLLLVNSERIPISFKAAKLEDDLLNGVDVWNKKPINEIDSKVYQELRKLQDEQHIIFEEWTKGETAGLVHAGYEKRQVTRVCDTGTMTCYVPMGMIDEKEMIDLPHFGKMSFTHYHSVVQLAANLILNGYTKVIISHSGGVDVEAEKDGITYAFEYETSNHDGEELVKKKERALMEFDVVKFVCNSTDAKYIRKFVGKNYILTRGSQLKEFIKSESSKPCTSGTLQSEKEDFEEIQETEEEPETLNQEQENFIKIDIIAPEISV
jgi:hypothetical protein